MVDTVHENLQGNQDNTLNMKYHISLLLFLFVANPVYSQVDTVRVSLSEFIEAGVEASGQIEYEYGQVELAQNRIGEARANRILPSAELNTNHGMVPGVVSRTGLPESQYYLDPNLENDWENWAIFTRAEVSALQPIFTFGAVDKAIRAAEYGFTAAEERFNASQADVELQMSELYYSHLLLIELQRIMDESRGTIDRVGDEIDRMIEEENPDLEQRNVFQYQMYRARFEMQEAELDQRLQHVRRIWREIMGGEEENITYLPEEEYLEPVHFEAETYEYYYSRALQSRSEMKGVDAGIKAYEMSLDAVRSQSYPMLYLGLTASFANTPNRPRQSNPFIINSTNFLSAGFGLGIRQNLNFSAIKNRINREQIEYNRVRDLRDALGDQILLEVSEVYSETVSAMNAVNRVEEALTISRRWVRNEQANADLGFGDMENLVEAVRNELELKVELQNTIYRFNGRVAELYNAAGISVRGLNSN